MAQLTVDDLWHREKEALSSLNKQVEENNKVSTELYHYYYFRFLKTKIAYIQSQLLTLPNL